MKTTIRRSVPLLFSACALAFSADVSRASSEATSAADTPEAWIAFASSRSGEGDLYAVKPSTGETIPVLVSAAPEGSPRYDVARQRLVHHRYENDVAALVSGSEKLFSCPNGDTAPVWSPDGSKIAYVAVRDGRADVYVAEPDGSGEYAVTQDDVIDRYPAWSPDGERLAIARRDETGWDVHVIDLSTSPPSLTRVSSRGEYVGHLAWSPDGARIACDMRYDGQTEIAVLDLATGDVQRLTERDGNDMVPAWSPDGASIAFAGEPAGSGNWDVWLVNVVSGKIRRLTEDPAFDGAPVFVPASVLNR